MLEGVARRPGVDARTRVAAVGCSRRQRRVRRAVPRKSHRCAGRHARSPAPLVASAPRPSHSRPASRRSVQPRARAVRASARPSLSPPPAICSRRVFTRRTLGCGGGAAAMCAIPHCASGGRADGRRESASCPLAPAPVTAPLTQRRRARCTLLLVCFLSGLPQVHLDVCPPPTRAPVEPLHQIFPAQLCVVSFVLFFHAPAVVTVGASPGQPLEWATRAARGRCVRWCARRGAARHTRLRAGLARS